MTQLSSSSNTNFDPACITSSISLLPFNNQVGGHTPFFRFSKRAICKPATKKEQDFYVHLESHHPELLPFISQYLGLLNATCFQNSSNNNHLPEVIFQDNEQLIHDWHQIISKGQRDLTDWNTPDILNDDFQQWSPNADECNSRFEAFRKKVLCEAFDPKALQERIQMVDALEKEQQQRSTQSKLGYIADSSSNDKLPYASGIHGHHLPLQASMTSLLLQQQEEEEEKKKKQSSHSNDSTSTTTPTRWQLKRTLTNPWSQQVYERDRQKLKQLTEGNVIKQFMLLEDLTDNIEFPCVLDLKMGTRQYGVFADENKVKSQTLKCAQSTSLGLGVRICGMQVYKKDKQEFVFRDKYKGRTLDEDAFKDNLRDYLDQHLELIPVLLHKLARLSRIIRSLKGYRFYGSSLLFIYNNGGKQTKKSKIDVRMIDFAKSVSPTDPTDAYTCPPEHPDEPDKGYLLGLSSLMDTFNEIYKAGV